MSQPLKKLIDKLLVAYGYEDQLNELELIKAYEKHVGELFVKNTKDIFVKNKALVLKLNSPILKQELGYQKEKLIRKLNAEVGKKVITKIIIV